MPLADASVSLLLAGFASWITAALLWSVGHSVMARVVPGESRFAGAAFGYGWYGLALSALTTGVAQASGAFGIDTLGWHVALKMVWYVLITGSLWAICTYLLYLFSGERTFTIPLAVFYGSALVGIVLLVQGADPVSVATHPWDVDLVYANAGFAGAAPRLVALLMLVPLVGGALGYLALLNVVTGRTQRFRIILVSATLAVWFGTAAIVHALELHLTQGWALTNLLLRLAAAGSLLVAYRPPAWLQRALRLEPEVNVDKRAAAPSRTGTP